MSLSRRLNSLFLSLERLGFSKEARALKIAMPFVGKMHVRAEPDMLSAIRQAENEGNIEEEAFIPKSSEGDKDLIAYVLKERLKESRFRGDVSLYQKHILFCLAPSSEELSSGRLSRAKIISDYSFGAARLERKIDSSKWQISLISLFEEYQDQGYGSRIYSWLTGPFLLGASSKVRIGNEFRGSSGLTSDVAQTPGSKLMWIKLFEKNMIDSDRVNPQKVMAVNEGLGRSFPIIRKDNDWFYDNGFELKPIWSGDKEDDACNISLEFLA